MSASTSTDRPEYTKEQLQNALHELYGGTADSPPETCAHIYGYNDPNHEMSMLQKITATTILDYADKLSSRGRAPSMEALLEKAKEMHESFGPILSLQAIIKKSSPSMALAAEFKRASPSKGDIAPHLDAGEQACIYYEAGASVISVLTEERWFKGSLDDLTSARKITTTAANKNKNENKITRPAILRKDFITSPYQIAEAAAAGADTVLLMVSTTPSDVLKELIIFARSVGMEPLVEVHALCELDVAIAAGAKVIGVNNRNLHTFELDLVQTEKVAEELNKRGLSYHHDHCALDNGNGDTPEISVSLCALSGMSSAHDVDRYRKVGVGMCLIGESLMRASDPALAIRGLCLEPKAYEATQSAAGGAYSGGTKIIKVCGITSVEDALVACRAGANLIGVIFAEKSKRKVSNEQAEEIVNAVRKFGERSDRVNFNETKPHGSAVSALVVKCREFERLSRNPLVVGVFQNSPLKEVKETVEKCGLDMVQLHGSEGMEAANSKNFGVPAMRVVDIELGNDDRGQKSPSATASAILKKVTSDPVAILLDTSIKGDKRGGGGTGKTFDWSIAKSIQDLGLPVLIAGGLTPENISEAVSNVRPWGVDVAGGVEARPGVKDHDKIWKFVGGARKAAAEANKVC